MKYQELQPLKKPRAGDKWLTACFAVVLFFFLLFGLVMQASAAVVIAPEPAAAQGDRYFREGEYRRAIAAYKSAVRLEPESSVLADALGQAYARAADTSELPGRLLGRARREFERALRLDPKNAVALAHLIELSAEPRSLCSERPPQMSTYLERLEQLDPVAAIGVRQQWRQRRAESSSAEARLACGPAMLAHSLQKAVTSRASD